MISVMGCGFQWQGSMIPRCLAMRHRWQLHLASVMVTLLHPLESQNPFPILTVVVYRDVFGVSTIVTLTSKTTCSFWPAFET